MVGQKERYPWSERAERVYKKGVKEQILEVVKKGDGTPIHKIAQGCGISIATASKYCYVLEAENKIKIVSFGNMKLVSRRGS